MQNEETPSALSIAAGALFSLWIGVMIAGVGLVFTPVIDPAAKAAKPKTGGTASKDAKAKEQETPAAKSFAEGNLNAPFFTYVRGVEAKGSTWKTMRENIVSAKGSASFKESDLNSWMLNFTISAAPGADAFTIVPERPNFRIFEGKLSASSVLNFANAKIPFVASGDFTGSGKNFKVSSGTLGSCPLPSFVAGMLLKKFSNVYFETNDVKELVTTWPKLKSAVIVREGDADVLSIIP